MVMASLLAQPLHHPIALDMVSEMT